MLVIRLRECINYVALMTGFYILVSVVEQKRYEMGLDLVSGVDFRCVLHHLSSGPRLDGGLGAKLGRKAAENRRKIKCRV